MPEPTSAASQASVQGNPIAHPMSARHQMEMEAKMILTCHQHQMEIEAKMILTCHQHQMEIEAKMILTCHQHQMEIEAKMILTCHQYQMEIEAKMILTCRQHQMEIEAKMILTCHQHQMEMEAKMILTCHQHQMEIEAKMILTCHQHQMEIETKMIHLSPTPDGDRGQDDPHLSPHQMEIEAKMILTCHQHQMEIEAKMSLTCHLWPTPYMIAQTNILVGGKAVADTHMLADHPVEDQFAHMPIKNQLQSSLSNTVKYPYLSHASRYKKECGPSLETNGCTLPHTQQQMPQSHTDGNTTLSSHPVRTSLTCSFIIVRATPTWIYTTPPISHHYN